MEKGMKARPAQKPSGHRQEGGILQEEGRLLPAFMAAQGRLARWGGVLSRSRVMIHPAGAPLLRGAGAGFPLREAMHGAGAIAGKAPG